MLPHFRVQSLSLNWMGLQSTMKAFFTLDPILDAATLQSPKSVPQLDGAAEYYEGVLMFFSNFYVHALRVEEKLCCTFV